MKEAIRSFRGQYRFLSNFYPAEVQFEGRSYRTVEHAFQAAKTLSSQMRVAIAEAPSPGHAKALGRAVTLRPDWEDVKIGVMRDLLRQKFGRPPLRDLLLATAPRQLIEGNTWGDHFWGICDGEGENHLGRLLEEVRTDFACR